MVIWSAHNVNVYMLIFNNHELRFACSYFLVLVHPRLTGVSFLFAGLWSLIRIMDKENGLLMEPDETLIYYHIYKTSSCRDHETIFHRKSSDSSWVSAEWTDRPTLPPPLRPNKLKNHYFNNLLQAELQRSIIHGFKLGGFHFGNAYSACQ